MVFGFLVVSFAEDFFDDFGRWDNAVGLWLWEDSFFDFAFGFSDLYFVDFAPYRFSDLGISLEHITVSEVVKEDFEFVAPGEFKRAIQESWPFLWLKIWSANSGGITMPSSSSRAWIRSSVCC